MSDIPNSSEVIRLLNPEPTRRTDIPASCFLAVLNHAEDAQQFHELCTKEGIILRVLGGNVLLVFSYDSVEVTGKFLKIFAHPQYEFALVMLGETQNF